MKTPSRASTRYLPVFALLLALAPACDSATPGEPEDREPVATTVRLSAREIALVEEDSATLSAAVLDEAGREVAEAAVAWSSSDTTVVRIDAGGAVRARGPGTAFLFAVHARADGVSIRDSARVSVRELPKIGLAPGSSTPYYAFEGVDYVVRFRVTDRQDAPLPGVLVRFEPNEAARVSPLEAVSDSLGVVTTRLSVAIHPGTQFADVTATVDGTTRSAWWGALARGRLSVRISPSPIVVPQGCEVGVWGGVYFGEDGQMAQTVSFGVMDTAIVRLGGGWGTGNSRGQTAGVYGKRLGRTMITAAYEGLAYDSAQVTVVARAPKELSLYVANPSVGIGGPAWVMPRLLAECGSDFDLPAVLAQSLDPAVAEVEAVDTKGTVKVVGRAPGTALVEVRAGTFVDTAEVTVLPYRLLPADTTVYAGARVQYRMVYEGSGPEPGPIRRGFGTPSPGAPYTITDSGVLTATAVGEGVVSADVVLPHGETIRQVWTGTTIRVVAPPGAARR